jgi:hypothetical protein
MPVRLAIHIADGANSESPVLMEQLLLLSLSDSIRGFAQQQGGNKRDRVLTSQHLCLDCLKPPTMGYLPTLAYADSTSCSALKFINPSFAAQNRGSSTAVQPEVAGPIAQYTQLKCAAASAIG